MELILLERQNKRKWPMARLEPDSMTSSPDLFPEMASDSEHNQLSQNLAANLARGNELLASENEIDHRLSKTISQLNPKATTVADVVAAQNK
jgi:hypothetical protein